jgi:serine/threonine protein kinase
LFWGKTVRENLPVFVKCFWGKNEIRHYENELEMLRTVQGCPYVQDLIHHGIDHRRPFAVLVTRYAGDTWTPGGMDKVLMKDLRSIGRQVLQALLSLHKKGIIHCDVKPGNICVAANGRATLIDFGLSIREGGGLINKPHVMMSVQSIIQIMTPHPV